MLSCFCAILAGIKTAETAEPHPVNSTGGVETHGTDPAMKNHANLQRSLNLLLILSPKRSTLR